MKPWFSLFLRRMLQMRRNFLTTCTTLGTRGEKLQADATFSGRNERPQNRTDAKPCLSDVYKMSTRAKRRQTDVRLSGRSMVEMLGVLAIIGILSVGAITGYSKAMMKYKLPYGHLNAEACPNGGINKYYLSSTNTLSGMPGCGYCTKRECPLDEGKYDTYVEGNKIIGGAPGSECYEPGLDITLYKKANFPGTILGGKPIDPFE